MSSPVPKRRPRRGPEAADVAVDELGAVVEPDHRPPVRVGLALVAVQHVAGHAEVDQERTARLEADDQVLAAAVDGGDALALELRGDLHRVERTRQPCVRDLDAVEAAAPAHTAPA